ncbi:glycosyltransferase family 4 protein [Manganibacter manganicus]|uniref:Glycosyl transferase n=1 Tax=Manganibacter manganicus TaxID=1873176 RepID=A0A1V8RSR2_9HYPH|nr:glycosyltransferase family 4 protein [Pseudaminobacter manganicus]OQM76230.1 glycosyl transferase [Pseudaminobacter manganicus]
MRAVQLTSVHPRDDIRIFRKQCTTLANAGVPISLVVADGKGDSSEAGVRIIDVGRPLGGRLSRMARVVNRVYRKALELDADLYHLHDPELLPIGLKLKKRGKKVIFDSHENYPADIRTKHYIPTPARPIISFLFSGLERYICTRLDHVVAATPGIAEHFRAIGCRVLEINNYPQAEELGELLPWNDKLDQVCYVGAMTSIRGVPELVDAMAHTRLDVRLALAGRFTEAATGDLCRKSAGWKRVFEHGQVSPQQVRTVMQKSMAGVVTFLPAPNHIDAQPNKMFEYMAAGIPVIGSNFPLWRTIIEGNQCGICVDPTNPSAIASAIGRLMDRRQEAEKMGQRGRKAILEHYSWERESSKLIMLYQELLNS